MKTVNVVAAIIVDGDKILVTQRGYGDYKGMWEFPGGKIELGEAPENALVREIQEELSATIKVGEWVGTVEYDYPTFHLVMRTFVCSIVSGEVIIKEHEAAKWTALEELKDIDWLPADKKLIEEVSWRLEWKIKYINVGREKKGDLHAYVFDSTKTLALMDDFEGRGKSDGPFKRLIFKNTQEAKIGDYLCKYHLIVERYHDVNHTEGNITFSEYKKDKGREVNYYCATQLREALKQNGKILKKKEFYFYEPYYLRAQNSGNREGYGWEWDWSGGIGIPDEGTFYGDTDNYAFVGVQIESAIKISKPAPPKKECPSNLRVETTMYQGKKYFKIYKNENESFLIPCTKGMTKEKAINIYRSSL